MLPQIKPVTTVKATLCGVELNFRKAKLGDSLELNEKVKQGFLGNALNIYMLAYLMDGYDETVEQRVDYLKSLPVSNLDDITTNITNILKDLGLQPADPKKK